MSEEVSRAPRKKAKKERTGSFDAVMQRRAHGDEPTWEGIKITDDDYQIKLIQAFNWASSSYDPATFKKIALEYMQGVEEYAFLKELPDYYFISGVGSRAWIRMCKAPTTPESDLFFKECL